MSSFAMYLSSFAAQKIHISSATFSCLMTDDDYEIELRGDTELKVKPNSSDPNGPIGSFVMAFAQTAPVHHFILAWFHHTSTLKGWTISI